MSDRQKIADRLRKKEAEMQGLEDKLRVGRVYIQALQDVLKMLDQDGEQGTNGDAVLKAGSAVAQARDLILASRAPMHLNSLLEAMGKEATREAKASLTSSLAAYVRRGEIFTRPAPSTFGLLELGHDDEAELATEPPAEFGRSVPSQQAKNPFEDDEDPF